MHACFTLSGTCAREDAHFACPCHRRSRGSTARFTMLGRTTRVPCRARGPRTLQRAMLRDGAERGGKVRVALQLARARRAPVGAQHRARRHAARPLQRLRVFAPLVPAAAWRAQLCMIACLQQDMAASDNHLVQQVSWVCWSSAAPPVHRARWARRHAHSAPCT